VLAVLSNAWRRLRANYWLALSFDAAAIVLLLVLIHAWQTRSLPLDEAAPGTSLETLNGSGLRPAVGGASPGVVYFFAPWCFYCRNSIDNLDSLVDAGLIDWATVVALDYADSAEVQAFIDETGVTVPVLLGNTTTATDWSVSAFPTYFVIDSAGRISSRSVGYSTWLGLWARARLAD
jgi:thiol-disulfide isomerase/thioredoxin